MKENILFHTAIIGGGASGLFCAGSFSQKKILLEANTSCALKVQISGGGKCNFTNKFVTYQDYQSQGKHFCKNALAAFAPSQFVNLLDQKQITWEEREEGRLFAFDAKEISKFLINRAKENNTVISCDSRVLDVGQENGVYRIITSKGIFFAQHIVLATGGLSFPNLGANGFGLKLASKLQLKQEATYPALCGLTFPKALKLQFSSLIGNSLPVEITCQKQKNRGSLLFAHQGITGPSVIQTSLFWEEGQPISINFLPGYDVPKIIEDNKNLGKTVSFVLGKYISVKIAKALLGNLDIKMAELTREQIKHLINTLTAFTFVPSGNFGYTKAEVTRGGIATTEINPSTFQIKKIPSMYVIGELVDVTGKMGGFNLHWAWCSGFVAAQHLANTY